MSVAKRVDEGPGPPAFVPNQNAELMKPAVAETTVGRADFLVELRGLCAGRPARSNRCKSDAMKE